MRALLYILTLLLFSLALPRQAAAQQPDWLVSWPVSFTMNPNMPRHVMAASSNGNVMSARLALGGMTFGQDVIGHYQVERIDPSNGQVMWACGLSDSVVVESGAIDDEGNIYVAGKYMGGIALCDGSVLGHTFGALFDLDLFLIKFNGDGLMQWCRNISVVQPDAASMAELAIDPNGDLWYATTDFFFAGVTRVDAMGNDVETRPIDGAKTIGGLGFSPSGAMYVSGSADFSGCVFGGITQAAPEQYNMFVLRFDAQGLGDWIHFAHDVTFQFPDLDVDASGAVYVAGNLMDSTSWGSIHVNGPDWMASMFVVKADSTGQFLWGVDSDPAGGTIQGDITPASRTTLALDGIGHVYVTGSLRGSVEWTNGALIDNGSLLQHTQAVAAFTTDGAPAWTASSDTSSIHVNAMDIAASDDGQVFFSAHATGEYDFTPWAVNIGGTQTCVLGRIIGTTTGLASVPIQQQAIAWPVPAIDHVTIDGVNGTARNGRLYASNGQCMLTTILQKGRNEVDLSALAPGPYTLVVGMQRWRIMKE